MVLERNSIDHKIMDAYDKTYGPTLDASHRISFSLPSSFTSGGSWTVRKIVKKRKLENV
jgi:hypothetical protein